MVLLAENSRAMANSARLWRLGERLLYLRLATFALLSLVLLPTVQSDMIIKQVVTGTSYNRCLQIMNVANISPNSSNGLKSLGDYGFLWAPNGANSWTSLLAPLSESGQTLAPGQTYLICHPSASTMLTQESDAFGSTLLFNGDDVLALAHRQGDVWTPIDAFGDLQNYRAQGWAVAGVLGATKLHTLVRKPEVPSGTLDWSRSAGTSGDNSQWAVYEQDTVSLLGVVINAAANSDSTLVQSSADCPGPFSNSKPQDRRENSTVIKLGTLTIPWLFDGINDPPGTPWAGGNICPGGGNTSVFPCNSTGAAERLAQLAAAVQQLDLDVLNVADVEDCSVLAKLGNSSDLRYRNFMRAGTDPLHRNVGLLTRLDPITALQRSILEVAYPITNSSCGYNGSGSTDASRHFVTRFLWGAFPVTLIGVELTDDDFSPAACAQREAEAQVLQLVINEALLAGQEVVLLGDMNDYSMDLDAGGNVPHSQVLRMLQDPDGDGVAELTSVSTQLPESQRVTTASPTVEGGPSVRKQLDYILLSLNLLASVTFVDINTTHLLDNASSHWPVIVHLSVPPAPPSTSPTPTLLPLPTSASPVLSGQQSSVQSGSDSSSSSSIVIIAAAVPTAAFILLVVALIAYVVRQRCRRRKVKRREVVAAEEGVTVGTWEHIDVPTPLPDLSSRPPSAWRPLDRSLPTIRSGEQLDMNLFANPLSFDDSF